MNDIITNETTGASSLSKLFDMRMNIPYSNFITDNGDGIPGLCAFPCEMAWLFDSNDKPVGKYFDFGAGYQYIVKGDETNLSIEQSFDQRMQKDYVLKDIQHLILDIPINFMFERMFRDYMSGKNGTSYIFGDGGDITEIQFFFIQRDISENDNKVSYIAQTSSQNSIIGKCYFEITGNRHEDQLCRKYTSRQLHGNNLPDLEKLYDLPESVKAVKGFYITKRKFSISYDYLHRMAISRYISA